MHNVTDFIQILICSVYQDNPLLNHNRSDSSGNSKVLI